MKKYGKYGKNKIAMVVHAGSGNHGCEAIVDSLTRMLVGQDDTVGRITLMTNSAQEDERYLPDEVKNHLDIVEEQHMDRHLVTHILYYAYRLLTHDRESFLRYRFRAVSGRGRKPRAAISIGGDTYCYSYMVEDNGLTNHMLVRQGTKTILLGCSVEPDLLDAKTPQGRALIEDMNRYSKILARESITYEALLSAGIPKEKVLLCPDPAFTLPVEEGPLPEGFESGNTVGINLSPLVEDYAKDKDIALSCCEALICHILKNTDMKVALIPHVVWERSNDMIPLRKLYDKIRTDTEYDLTPEMTGRVLLVEDMRAERLKGVIANCRFFIGARTHATIAAYSTLVPTLVIGYSVKARGIARDLFGTEDGYTIPVQSLQDPAQLISAFRFIYENEDQIRYQLAGAVARARQLALENAGEVLKLLEE